MSISTILFGRTALWFTVHPSQSTLDVKEVDTMPRRRRMCIQRLLSYKMKWENPSATSSEINILFAIITPIIKILRADHRNHFTSLSSTPRLHHLSTYSIPARKTQRRLFPRKLYLNLFTASGLCMRLPRCKIDISSIGRPVTVLPQRGRGALFLFRFGKNLIILKDL